MSEPARGSDHDARIAALRGFQRSITSGVDAGLAQLGPLNDPVRVFAALQLLIQNDRFQDAVDLIATRRLDCKWVEQAVYAYVALKDVASARRLLTFAFEECEGKWVSDRCRLFVAEAAFTEVLKETSTDITVGDGGISDDDRAILNLVIEVVEPLIAPVRATGHIDGTLQRTAVEFAANAYGMLGQMSKIRDLATPMANCRPLPLLLAQLTLRGICEPRDGLSGRIRAEHSENFAARLLAALLDREIYDRGPYALLQLLSLKDLAISVGNDSIEQLCQVLFETASSLDLPSMAKARSAVDELLGTDNPFRQYFDAVAYLMQQQPQSALATLDAQKRHDHGVWWQIAAKAHELNGDPEEAAKCWDQACQLMPHPDLLDRFAGFSVQQHRFEDAVRALKAAIPRSPGNTRLMERLAYAHSRLREFSEAAVIFRSLIQIEPTAHSHRINLAVCESRIGNPQLALDALTPIIDLANPDLRLIAFRTELLNSLNRAHDAFADLEQLAEEHWRNPHFLILYLDTAYRSGNDKSANAAFRQLLKMQHGGELAEPVFQPASLDDIKKQGLEYFRQRDDLHLKLVKGQLPWLAAEALLRVAPEQAWHRRTQSLRWLAEAATARGEWNTYSTNGFSTQQNADGKPTVERIGQPAAGAPVVADMSSIITLHRLGRLAVAAEFLGKVILPASLGELAVRDARRLLPHQPSRERELRLIRDMVDRRLIEVLDPDAVNGELLIVDEYGDEEQKDRFVLRDVYEQLRSAQLLSTQELDELSPLCHRPPLEGRTLPPNSRVVFEMNVLRTLAEFNWLERIVSRAHWCVLRDDYEDEIHDLVAYEFQRDIYQQHQELWEEIRKLLDTGLMEYRSSPSCRATVADDDEDEDVEPPPFLDAVLLANDLGHRLLADDRFCQAVVLNQSPAISDAAFGTDRLLVAIEASGRLQADDVLRDLLQLMRWRYRFLLPEPHHLKCAANHSNENLPGPELREIAAYVQDSMRDPGLFCGPENADPPTPMAFSYFMAWKRTCIEFLAIMWEDPTYEDKQLSSLTVWCIQSLFPAVPRGMLYTPVGRRMADFIPKAFLIAAMVRFATVQPLKRANDALRIIAAAWGLSPDEFYEAAAEAADDRLD